MSKRVEWTLPVQLTEEEKASIAAELAIEVRQHKEIDDEKKEVMADFNARLKQKELIIRVLAHKVETGTDERQVMCEWAYHSPERGHKELIRQDTFEVVTVREMDEYDEAAYAAEMQTALPFN